MEYKKIESASLNGASAFAELAKIKLQNKEKEGLRYLMVSLILLRDYLAYEREQLRNLNETISIVNTIRYYGDKIPYNQLFFLADELNQLPILEKIPGALDKFLEFEEIKWAKDFVEIPQRKGMERISLSIEKYIIPLAVVLVTFLGVLPENIKMQIVDVSKQIAWFQLLGIFLSLFLIYELFSFLSRMIELSYSDIKEISGKS